ncbi:MAG TPA: hypothetical protein VH210_11440 [Gaiellaceae bacterium]|nr:hypothetical protein [Gaiellaceae bacterium]
MLYDTIDPTACIRCGNAVGAGAVSYCYPCLWAVRAEVEEGFGELEELLRKAALEVWLREHEGGHE